MAVISLCFSGNPRTILNYRDAWETYFDMIRAGHELRIYFHCWSDAGLVARSGNQFIEGSYKGGIYDSFDQLLAFLRPAAFRIENPVRTYDEIIDLMGDIYVSSIQPRARAVLSQLHSNYQADEVRREHEKTHGPSDVVMKLRFDLKPVTFVMREINYLLHFPHRNVLFAPSLHWHTHPGGGGGCLQCHDFFDREHVYTKYDENAVAFLDAHPDHGNDICDLYATGNSTVMQIYSGAFARIAEIYGRVKQKLSGHLDEYIIEPSPEGGRILRIQNVRSGWFDIENSPIFVPEKIIRENLRGFVISHGETCFVTERR